MKTATYFSLMLCFALIGCPAIEVARPTCTSDTECKGARICDEGTCVDPPQGDGVSLDSLDGFGADSTADAAADADAVSEISDTLADLAETSLDAQDGAGGEDVGSLDGAETSEDASEEVAADAEDDTVSLDASEDADGSEDADASMPPDADTSVPSLCPTFADAFEAASLNSWWTKVFPDHVGLEGGELALTVTAAPNDEFVRAALNLPGGFEGATATLEVGKLAGPNAVMRLWVQRLPSSLNENTEISISSGSVAARYNDESGNTLVTKIDYDAEAHRWLRLVHTGGQMLYQTSADGQTFENLATVDLPFSLDAVNVAIAAANAVALDADETVSAASFELICGE